MAYYTELFKNRCNKIMRRDIVFDIQKVKVVRFYLLLWLTAETTGLYCMAEVEMKLSIIDAICGTF